MFLSEKKTPVMMKTLPVRGDDRREIEVLVSR